MDAFRSVGIFQNLSFLLDHFFTDHISRKSCHPQKISTKQSPPQLAYFIHSVTGALMIAADDSVAYFDRSGFMNPIWTLYPKKS